MEFGPCSVRDLYDYLRSPFALTRGLYCSKNITIDAVRRELNALVSENREIVRYSCHSGTKIRYGVTLLRGFSQSETRFLKPNGVMHTCIYCGLRIFECDGRKFHFPAMCTQNVAQNYFKILKIKDAIAIISDDFVYGIIDDVAPYILRLSKEIHRDITGQPISELWYINRRAQQKKFVPVGRLLPLKTKETSLE